ncbi:hypothetical protein D3C71_1908350 [compost metagenome]
MVSAPAPATCGTLVPLKVVVAALVLLVTLKSAQPTSVDWVLGTAIIRFPTLALSDELTVKWSSVCAWLPVSSIGVEKLGVLD